MIDKFHALLGGSNHMDVGLLVLRLIVGLYLFGHGTQKLFGWFGGPGMAGTEGFVRSLGFRPPKVWAINVALAETVGGLLLVLGLLNPLGSLAIAGAMLVAIVTVHLGKGLFAMTGGPELPLVNIAGAVAVALAGPGRYSLDSWLGISLPEPAVGIVLTVLTLLGVGVALLSRRPQPADQAQPAAS
jgi:putative oxidoreductase